MHAKSPKHIQSIYTTQQRKVQSPNPLISTAKLTIAKFSRQSNSRLLQSKKSLKSSRHIPDLNLESANSPREAINAKEQNAYQMKHQYKGETKQANLLTSCRSYRDSEYEVIATGRQLKLSTSDQYIYSPMQTMIRSSRSKVGSDSFNTDVDKEEVLLMEVKQLKRENTILKKKIKDLQKEINGGVMPEEYQQPVSGGGNSMYRGKKGYATGTSNIQSLHLSVNLFFQQIRNLLTTATHLFQVSLTPEQQKKLTPTSSPHNQQQIPQLLNSQTCPLRRHEILKKHYLNKKLQLLSCEDDCQQYSMLLSIFLEYYTFKQQSQKKIVETVDSMVMYMNDLGKWLGERTAVVGKLVRSDGRIDDGNGKERVSSPPPKFEAAGIRVPAFNTSNHVKKLRGTTLSPLAKIK